MSGSRLMRWAGWSAVAGGVLLAITDVLFLTFGDQPTSVAATSNLWILTMLLNLLGGYFVLLGLFGLFARQSAQGGGLGITAFILASLGSSFYIAYLWAGAFVVPHLTEYAPEFLDLVDTEPSGLIAIGFLISFLGFALGWALMGYTTTRTQVVPPLAGWSLVAGSILNFVFSMAGLPFGTALYGLALVWVGWSLGSERESPAM